MYERILVPVDGSAQSSRGLDEALKIARSKRAHIRLIHMINGAPLASPGLTGEKFEAVFAQVRDDGRRLLDLAEAYVSKAGIAVDAKLIETAQASLSESVAQEAESWPADLIVCGTHARGGLLRTILGSEAEEILRHSPVPVLLVPTHSKPPSGTRVDIAQASGS
jgi:nucleotide-binding universal stress UspA family protein